MRGQAFRETSEKRRKFLLSLCELFTRLTEQHTHFQLHLFHRVKQLRRLHAFAPSINSSSSHLTVLLKMKSSTVHNVYLPLCSDKVRRRKFKGHPVPRHNASTKRPRLSEICSFVDLKLRKKAALQEFQCHWKFLRGADLRGRETLTKVAPRKRKEKEELPSPPFRPGVVSNSSPPSPCQFKALVPRKDVDKLLTCPRLPPLPLPPSLHLSSLYLPESWCGIPIGADGSAMVHASPLRNTKQRGWEGGGVWRWGEGEEPCQRKKEDKKDDMRDRWRHGWIDGEGVLGGGGTSSSSGSRRILLKMSASSQSRSIFFNNIFIS